MHAALDDHRRYSLEAGVVRECRQVVVRWLGQESAIVGTEYARRTRLEEVAMSTLDNMFEEREVVREAARDGGGCSCSRGIAWLVFSLIIFRFDITSAASIAILFGIVAIMAGVDEFMAIGVSTTGWKIVHGILGVIFVLVGIFAFIEPGSAFAGARRR